MAMYMINNLIDDVVTKKLKTVLAMGEHGGTKYSDIVVKDGNIMIKNLYARPEEITKKLSSSPPASTSSTSGWAAPPSASSTPMRRGPRRPSSTTS